MTKMYKILTFYCIDKYDYLTSLSNQRNVIFWITKKIQKNKKPTVVLKQHNHMPFKMIITTRINNLLNMNKQFVKKEKEKMDIKRWFQTKTKKNQLHFKQTKKKI